MVAQILREYNIGCFGYYSSELFFADFQFYKKTGTFRSNVIKIMTLGNKTDK